MTTIIGYDFYGVEFFNPPSPPSRNIGYIEIANCIVDEISIREGINVDTSHNRDIWETDTRLLARFQNDLEGGNIRNNSLKIIKFAIKRRSYDEIEYIKIGEAPFLNSQKVEFIDYTQPNDRLVYSVVPISENGLEGRPNEVEIESDFVGWFIVDKDEQNNPNPKNILVFDTFMDSSSSMVNVEINQGRTEIKTMSKYPQIYYTDEEYAQFSLKGIVLPSQVERSDKEYQRLVQKFILLHKPKIVKGSDGQIYVCDVYNPRRSSPQNSYQQFDWIDLSVDCVEVYDYKSFIESR